MLLKHDLRRTRLVSIRMTADEYKYTLEAAQAANSRSVADYMRVRILGGRINEFKQPKRSKLTVKPKGK